MSYKIYNNHNTRTRVSETAVSFDRYKSYKILYKLIPNTLHPSMLLEDNISRLNLTKTT